MNWQQKIEKNCGLVKADQTDSRSRGRGFKSLLMKPFNIHHSFSPNHVKGLERSEIRNNCNSPNLKGDIVDIC